MAAKHNTGSCKVPEELIKLFWLHSPPQERADRFFQGVCNTAAAPCLCLHCGGGQWICLRGNNRQGINKRDLILQWAHLLKSSFEARLPNHTFMDWYWNKIKAQFRLSVENRAGPQQLLMPIITCSSVSF